MITSFSAGIMLILIGFLVWRFRLVGFIVGRNAAGDTDKEGLARWIGKNMIMMGIVLGVFAVIQVILFRDTRLFVDVAIILVLSTRMAMGASKFSKPVIKISDKKRKEKKRPKK
jgi:hypothetical protein